MIYSVGFTVQDFRGREVNFQNVFHGLGRGRAKGCNLKKFGIPPPPPPTHLTSLELSSCWAVSSPKPKTFYFGNFTWYIYYMVINCHTLPCNFSRPAWYLCICPMWFITRKKLQDFIKGTAFNLEISNGKSASCHSHVFRMFVLNFQPQNRPTFKSSDWLSATRTCHKQF